MRLKQYITEKAIPVTMADIRDVIHTLDYARENINKFKDANQFLDFINSMLDEITHGIIQFKYRNDNSSAVTGETNMTKYKIFIEISKDYFDYIEDPKVYRKLVNGVIGTLKHEITHFKQLNKVSDNYWNNKSYPKRVSSNHTDEDLKKYYSHKHEIMAHAQNILIDLINYFGVDTKKILSYIKRYNKSKDIGISHDFDEYMRLFPKNDKVIKLLYRYMYDIIRDEYLPMELRTKEQ